MISGPSLTSEAHRHVERSSAQLSLYAPGQIPGFGKFKVRDTPEREARNPATGATIKVVAAKKLTFAPAKALRDALNG